MLKEIVLQQKASIWRALNPMNFYVQFEPPYLLFCLCRTRSRYYINPRHLESPKFNFCSTVEVEHTSIQDPEQSIAFHSVSLS